MKKLLIAVSLFMLINGAKAQKTADVGIWGGTGTSFGDMTQTDLGSSLGFNYGAFVRYNFNPRVAARLQLMNGAIKGDGKFDSSSWSFGPKNVTSLSVMAEINFFRYYLGDKKTPFTTYLLGGLGVGMYPYDTDNVFAPQIPLGFGTKFNLGEKVGVGVELLMNRYFDDRIDDLDDPRSNTFQATYNDKWHNNDYTMYLGLHLTYKINLSKMPCPVYEY